MKKLVAIFIITFFSTLGLLIAGPVFNCNKCNGSGRVTVTRQIRCSACNGQRIICRSCNGKGSYVIPSEPVGPYGMRMPDVSRPCLSCYGRGIITCNTCYGSHVETLTGTDTCPQCQGRGSFTL